MNESHQTSTLGAGALVVFDNKVLLVQMAYGQNRGQWILPGGMVDAGEFPHLAAEREVFEETGLKVQTSELIVSRHRLYNNKPSNIYSVFRCEILTPQDQVMASLQWPKSELISAQFWNVPDLLKTPEIRPMTQLFVKIGLRLPPFDDPNYLKKHRLFKPQESQEADSVYLFFS